MQSSGVGVHRCSCGYPPSPRGGPALWETLKVATFAIPQSHSVDCKAERVRPGRCGNDTPIVPSASWRRSKTVTRNGRRTSPRRRGTSRLTAGTSGVRCSHPKPPLVSPDFTCALRGGTPRNYDLLQQATTDGRRRSSHRPPCSSSHETGEQPRNGLRVHGAKYSKRNYTGERLRSGLALPRTHSICILIATDVWIQQQQCILTYCGHERWQQALWIRADGGGNVT